MALVAATTLGGGQFSSIRASVCFRDNSGWEGRGERFRLIVQSYEAGAVGDDGYPAADARPLASTQLSVSSEELHRGVSVDVLHVGAGEMPEKGRVVVAWAEPGQPDLEFDGLMARPGPESVYGVCHAGRRTVVQSARVVLGRRASAG